MYKVGDEVEIIDCRYGHMFRTGEIVTVTGVEDTEGDGSYLCRSSVNGQLWWTGHSEMRLFAACKELAVVEKSEQDVKDAKKGRYVYVVQNKDGIIEIEQDRDDARKVKAALGGKAEGVVIVAYAPVKEIR